MERAAATPASAQSDLLPAATVMAIAGLQVRARCVADGVLAGLHRSKRQGESAEFAEHKLYAPGDDVRRIDWKAFGRRDRYYVRRYQEETSLGAFLVVDTSGSMTYPEQGRHSKYQYAATLAASLAYLLLRQSDAVGLITFAAAARRALPLSGRQAQLDEMASALEQAPLGGRTDAQAALSALGELVRRHALVVVLTDLLGAVDGAGGLDQLFGSLAVLRARGADVALLQVLDPDEIELPFPGVVRFFDLESEREIQVDAGAIRDAYRDEVRSFLARVENAAATGGMTYQLVRTDEPPVAALTRFVANRARWS
ncbi:MAG: DUF58 domain-containing protein [Deltaproteobacteria bacterium]|nr:DUF58 domain-containing protein [Deltaproteobacteria bacterium]